MARLDRKKIVEEAEKTPEETPKMEQIVIRNIDDKDEPAVTHVSKIKKKS